MTHLVDVVAIRENTEGEYSAMSHSPVDGVVEALKICTRSSTERIARYAFDYATKWGRQRVTCVHKGNDGIDYNNGHDLNYV